LYSDNYLSFWFTIGYSVLGITGPERLVFAHWSHSLSVANVPKAELLT
jgi:hypothetical protein